MKKIIVFISILAVLPLFLIVFNAHCSELETKQYQLQQVQTQLNYANAEMTRLSFYWNVIKVQKIQLEKQVQKLQKEIIAIQKTNQQKQKITETSPTNKEIKEVKEK